MPYRPTTYKELTLTFQTSTPTVPTNWEAKGFGIVPQKGGK